MRQDWVYPSFWAMGLQRTGLYFLWLCPLALIKQNTLWGIWTFFNPKAACLSLQRRCEALSSSMEPEPDGFGAFWPTLQRDPLISGPGYNSQWNKTSLSYLSVKSLFIYPEWFRPFEKPFFMRRTLWHPYQWAMFVSECHWCKIVSDSSYTQNVFLPLLLERQYTVFL
jgi:hypothetical protein